MAESGFINPRGDPALGPGVTLLGRRIAGERPRGALARSRGYSYAVPLVDVADLTRLERRLGQAVERCGPMVAILYADIDQVSPFDDTHGQELGDQLLRAVAGRLIGVISHDDLLAYLGDRRFVVLCETLDDISAVEALVARMADALEGEYALTDVNVLVDPRVGVSFAGRGENIPVQLRNVAINIREEAP